jgi:hypothetical protein
MDPKTETITTNRLKIPQFIPLAIGESDLPKQAAQAKAECEVSARASAPSDTNLLKRELIKS